MSVYENIMNRDLSADNQDPLTAEAQHGDFAVLAPDWQHTLEGSSAELMGAPNLLESLRETHQPTIEQIKQLATVAIIHSSNPDNYEGVVTPAGRTRSYKSYQPTAEYIARTLAQIGFSPEHVIVASDVDLLCRIGDPVTTSPNLVWLNTGGVQGHDPMAQTPALLEAAGISYIGHRPVAYGVADNKVFADAVLRSKGVPTPRSIELSDASSDASIAAACQPLLQAASSEPYVIVKPINGRGSVGVERLDLREETEASLANRLRALSEQYSGIKLDEYLPGEEVTVSVIRTKDKVVVFPPLKRQIDPETGIFESLDKQAVADRVDTLAMQDPAYRQIVTTTGRAYTALGLEGLARLDLRANIRNDFAVIDVNPKPDLGTASTMSLTEIAAKAGGFSFDQLIEFILLCRTDQGFRAYPEFKKIFTNP